MHIISIHMIDNKIKIFILYLVALGLLYFSYVFFVVPVFHYSGYDLSPNKIKVFESLLIVIITVIFFLPSKIKHPSDFFIHVHFLFPILPMLVLYGASDFSRGYIFFVIMAFLTVCLFRKSKLPQINKDIIPNSIALWSLLIFALSYIVFIISNGGFKYFNLDILRVYEYRKSAADNLPLIAGYFSPMFSEVVLPSLFVIAASQKKWAMAILSLGGSVMMFGLTNHKGPLFYPFIVFAMYYLLQRLQKSSVKMLLIGYNIIIILSLMPFLINNIESTELSLFAIVLGSLVIRRGFFLPAHINFLYHDFFSTHPHTIWADSKLTFKLIKYPYDLDPAHLIGYNYFDSADAGANTGWLGTGFMHLGFAGMLLYAFIIAILLAIVDTYAKRKNNVAICFVFIPLMGLFLSSDIPTVMLTGGLLFALFLLYACKFEKVSGSLYDECLVL